MSLVLLGGSVSPFVRKVRVVLEEKGLPYQHEQVNPFAPPPGYREISPLGKIPALKDGDLTLCDSSVICAYLEKKYPSPALYPSDPADYARALWIEEFMDGGVMPAAGPNLFLALVLRPLLAGKAEPDADAVATAEQTWSEKVAPLLEYLEKQLGDREWFVGDRMTIADVSVASILANARHAGFAPERKRFPKLRAFLDRMWARPAFKKAIEEESPIFGKRAARITD
ncbi:MAG: glutathione S-transferase family protein [Proteobacteria bacterium]|nr:MAG: glutathione S-transferase family protein [Pseudomonadota bacterium]